MSFDDYDDPKALRVEARVRALFPNLAVHWQNTGGNILCFTIQLDDENYIVWGTADLTWGYCYASDGDENPLKEGEVRETNIPSEEDCDEDALVKAIEQSIRLHKDGQLTPVTT